MRLTQKKIEEILAPLIKEEGIPLLRELLVKQNISEFDLATKVKKDIKVVRRVLYILYNHNLVSFIRKKDKIKGWYIYYWTLLPESVRYLYYKRRKEQKERLQGQLEEEKKELFFTCRQKCVRLNFDQGMDFEFRCPECGELLDQDSSEEKTALLQEEIQLLQQELLQSQREKKKEKRQEKKKTIKKRKILKKKKK